MRPSRIELDAFLDRAEARHNGRSRWESGHGIQLDLVRLAGPIPLAKGVGTTFPPFGRLIVWPKAGRVEALDWPKRSERGQYVKGDISIVPAAGSPRFVSTSHCRTFDGFAKYRRWRPEDALYFFGYALTHYLSLPYRLRSDQVVDFRQTSDSTVITVHYPAGSETHGRRERMYFSPDGLLERHDYHADILGPGAHGAHFSLDYTELDGIPIATRREVRLVLAGVPTPLVVLLGLIRPSRWVAPV